MATVVDGAGRILQTCCNHWECPICGLVRAEEEYRRIVYGARTLSELHDLYFWTLTCNGKEISLDEAEENYYRWTNKLLNNARQKAHREKASWAYVQVTERQKATRLHPHSHIITTFFPPDGVATADASGRRIIVSSWFVRANKSAGLGSQHKISKIDSPVAVARYIAKYMKKQSMMDSWPPHWKRVRYSLNWPKLPVITPVFTPDFSLLLLSPKDWEQLDRTPYEFATSNAGVAEYARHRCVSVRLTSVN